MIQKELDAAKVLAIFSVLMGSLITMTLFILLSFNHEQKRYIAECDREETLSFCTSAWEERADVFAKKVMIP